MNLRSITLTLGLMAVSTPAWCQAAAGEAATAEPTLGQPVTIADLEGTEIEAKVVREQIVRREGRQFPITIHADWKVGIGRDGIIELTYVPTAHTPRGTRRGKMISGLFRIDQTREVSSGGGGQAVWLFQDATLTFQRTFKQGALRNTIAFARGPEGLTCTTAEAFAREKGTGPIEMNSVIDGAPTTIISSKQVSSSCRVTKRE